MNQPALNKKYIYGSICVDFKKKGKHVTRKNTIWVDPMELMNLLKLERSWHAVLYKSL